MAESTFKVGDVVQLASGGPKMTVSEVAEYVTCVWMDNSQKFSNSFEPGVLIKFKKELGI